MTSSQKLNHDQISAINAAIAKGLKTLEVPEPLRLSEWAEEYFYLSPESSYIEGAWEAMPYQIGIMDCISNDDIREIWFRKSARVGYTKMILAAMAYFAEHKRRNQAVWQPVDDDADEFVKTELDPLLRDCLKLRDVFPYYDKKHKNNTLRLKAFTGSMLHIRGGKAAKNYRRISIDVAYLDEIDAFDRDVEREGSPRKLAGKRLEGATFPKFIGGSTPKIKNESLIEEAEQEVKNTFRYHIPCPRCKDKQPLTWGGKDIPHGFKWKENKPETVAHQCAACGKQYTQDEYLNVWQSGRWQNERGDYIDADNIFRNEKGEIIETPLRIAFHLWTAYSPMTSWSLIVMEFLDSKGDKEKLKTFINTTLGETWEEDESEKLDEENIYNRREPLTALPDWVMVLTAGIDTQDDRFEIQIDGWGEGEERISVDYIRLYGDPSRADIWDKLGKTLKAAQYQKQDGTLLNVRLVCQDHGGHYPDEVNKMSIRMGRLWWIPVKGSSTYGNPVAKFPRKPNQKKVYLTEVGTDTAKELLKQRLEIMEPGPGYWHFPISEKFDREYFKQLTAEERVPKWVKGVKIYYWDAKGRRQEPWDCSVYSLAAIRILQQHMGIVLESKNNISHGRGVRSRGI